MRVLYLQHSLGFGGATKSLLLMQQSLKDVLEIYTVIPKVKQKHHYKIVKEFKFSKKIFEMDIPPIYSYSERTISSDLFHKNKNFYPQKLIEIINENKIDILHINSTLFSHLLKFIKEETASKIVVHIREMLPYGPKNEIDAYIINNISQYSDAIIAISDNEVRYFSNVSYNIVPNPHDFELTDDLLQKIKRSEDKKIIIGMCANFLKIKGHLVFLQAAKIIENELKNKNINIEFRIIGYPDKKKGIKEWIKKILKYGYKYEFEEKLKKLKLDNLKIIPFTFDIYKEIIEFDIYVRPDLSENPWGRDIIEAMALKKPVIATGDSEFFIKNGKTGFLIPAGNPNILAQKILHLISKPKLRSQMGETGYKVIKKMCDINNYKERILNIYDRI